MICTLEFQKQIEEFLVKYPKDDPVQLDDKFRDDVELICNGLSDEHTMYSEYSMDSTNIKIVDYVSIIMLHFQKADILEPLNYTNYILYLKLSQLVEKLKLVIILELFDDGFIIPDNIIIFDFKAERYICDTYQSKIEDFKNSYNEEEVQIISEHFTHFLLEFLNASSKLSGEKKLFEKYVKLLLVINPKTLAENIHCISFVIPKTDKIIIMQNITNFCIKNDFNLKNCDFINLTGKKFKFEVCVITYYTFQHICQYLEGQKIHQTSQILSGFTIEEIISIINSVTFNPKFEKCCEESVNLITFKTYNKIKVVPSHDIKKCLNILNILLHSLSNYNLFQSCSFAIILLSMVSEFIMETDLDKPTLISMIDLLNGYLDVSKLPQNFKAVYYAFKIYQKLKLDIELEKKAVELCKSLSANLHRHHHYIQIDVESVMTYEDNLDDKSIVVSYFLNNYVKKIEVGPLKNLFYTLNEQVLISSQFSTTMNVRLIYPYSVSLNFSILNRDEDCLFNNLAVLDEYLTIFLNENQTIGAEDKKNFLTIILRHYEIISQSLPDNFFLKCWEYLLNPQIADINISKELLQRCSSKNLSKLIEMLKVETMKIIEKEESVENNDFHLFIHNLWHVLLNMQFNTQNKKVRKDQVNHFCFFLNNTFLFNKNQIKNENSLVLILKLVSSLLKLPWVNKETLMNCSLRIITIVESSSNPDCLQPIIEAGELLIVLYECPNNFIKPLLGLYMITFINLVKKCWLLFGSKNKSRECLEELIIPFQKFEKCSSLFKQNKSDFEMFSRYIIEYLVELISPEINLRDGFMRHYYNIIINLMDVCSSEELKQLLFTIQGPAAVLFRDAYSEYRSRFRPTGRINWWNQL